MYSALTSIKQAFKVVGISASSSILVILGAGDVFAGDVTVVTTGDSTAAGTIDFNPESNVNSQIIETNGGTVTLNFGNVQATAMSPATAVNTGILEQGWVDVGVGSGGAVINMSSTPQVVAAIANVGNTSTIEGAGLQGSPSLTDALLVLASSSAIQDLSVAGTGSSIMMVLNNLSGALLSTSADPVLLPTALNDAAVAIRLAIQDQFGANINTPESESRVTPELITAARIVSDLLAVIRD